VLVPPPFRPVADADQAPIFVVGTGRSGATLLRQMLDAHPRIHVTHEAAFYVYRAAAPPRASAREWLVRYFDTFSFAWLRVAPAEVLEELAAMPSPQRTADAARALMRRKARLRGKARFGEKNPLDVMNLGRIFADFADARVVHVVRDPRATVASMLRMPWAPPGVLLDAIFGALQARWLRPHRARVLEVRLEDLAADPRATMGAVLGFAGEPWDDAVLDHVRHASRDDVAPLPWFMSAATTAPSCDAPDGGWRETFDDVYGDLAPAAIRLVERVDRETMGRYGYAPARLAREPTAAESAALALREIPSAAGFARRLAAYRSAVGRHMRGEARVDPQRAFEATLRFNPAAWRFHPGLQVPRVPRPPPPDPAPP
jgi:hypothetical protein